MQEVERRNGFGEVAAGIGVEEGLDDAEIGGEAWWLLGFVGSEREMWHCRECECDS